MKLAQIVLLLISLLLFNTSCKANQNQNDIFYPTENDIKKLISILGKSEESLFKTIGKPNDVLVTEVHFRKLKYQYKYHWHYQCVVIVIEGIVTEVNYNNGKIKQTYKIPSKLD
jgi:hypothetical protein